MPEESTQIEVRRRRGLPLLIAIAALALGSAFAVRTLGTPSDDVLGVVIAAMCLLIALAHAWSLRGSRVPMAVADSHGVRVRSQGAGATDGWQGFAWSEMDEVEHFCARTPWRDGEVVLRPTHHDEVHIPTTLATALVGSDLTTLTNDLEALAAGRCEVYETEAAPRWSRGTSESATVESVETTRDEEGNEVSTSSTDEDEVSTSPADVESGDDKDETAAGETHAPAARTVALAAPIRAIRQAIRVDLGSTASAGVAGTAAVEGATARQVEFDVTEPLPEVEALRPSGPEDWWDAVGDDTEVRTPGWIDGRGGDEPPTDEDDEPDPELTVALTPVAEPVIGNDLQQARRRLALTVDELAERTRIRPHVIEAIEVDDFAPCGGDFYARGHLKTLCRVLGIDSAPVLALYTQHYASAPVDTARLFEAELATTGSMRTTRGGPNWSLLVAAVMAIVLVWSVAQLVLEDSAPSSPVPELNPSGGLDNAPASAPKVPVVLTAEGGGARVVVRDERRVVFNGDLAFGQSTTLQVSPPIRISSTDGSVNVTVDGKDEGPIGQTGADAQNTYVAR